MEIGLSLGSNMGDRLVALQRARAAILAQAGMDLEGQSPVYETEPVDVPAEFRAHRFLNAVLILETLVPIRQMLHLFQRIEQQLGRQPDPAAYRPRPLDIDIVYAGALDVREPDLEIPHPRWARRRFVLQPLADVRPDLVLPGQTRPVSDLLTALDDPHAVTLFATTW